MLVEPRLDRLGVPVAEVVEREVVEHVRRRREVERAPRLLDLLAREIDPGQDPALLERGRIDGRLDPLRVLEDQPRDVPELVRELAALLDRAGREAHVLGRRDLEQPVPRRVGAVGLDHLERVDARPEALRHPPAVGREDGRVDDHVRERDLAHQLEAGPDHPVLPEPDDLARGRVDVARVVRLRAPASAPASRGWRTARAPTRTTCRARPDRASARRRRPRAPAPPPRSWRR